MFSCIHKIYVFVFLIAFIAKGSQWNFVNAMKIQSSPNIPSVEMTALHDLYINTGGSNWSWAPNVTEIGTDTYTNGIPWNFTADANPCTDNWQGINCTFTSPYTNYHITGIVLVEHNLHGQLPETIGNFTELRYLNFASNHLNGSLPVALRHLTQLLSLSLVMNQFHGTVPAIYQSLSVLREIFLTYNDLSGSFPTQLANLPNLRQIGIERNRFTGTIPTTISNFNSVQSFYIDYNYFEGSLPSSICELTSLFDLHFSNNYLTGTIPTCIDQLINLQELKLQSNRLTGIIPESLDQLKDMVLLYLYDNELTGSLPASIGNLNHLQEISVQQNYLTGSLPDSFGQLSHLTNLYVENNHMGGTLAPALGGLSSLIFVYLSGNVFHGALPPQISNWTQLTSFFGDNNKFSGSLDGVFNATLQKYITTIEVSDNQITGTLPDALFSIPTLSTFAAVSNCFHGIIPLSICDSPSLSTLILDGLRSGSTCRNTIIPGLSSRYTLQSHIRGGIPSCLFSIPKLRTLHLSGNGLTGSLPNDAVIVSHLLDFSVSHNELTGTIPSQFHNRAWYNLDLSYNRLTGVLQLNTNATYNDIQTENQYYNLSLTADSVALTLRNNRLSGNLPTSIDQLVNISVLDGNLFTCNLEQTDLPAYDSGKNTYQCGSNSFNISYYIWLCVLGGIIGSLLLIFIFRKRLMENFKLDRILFYYDKWMHHVEFLSHREKDQYILRNYKYLIYVCQGVCKVSALCTLFILVVLLPIYVSTSAYYGTHIYQYAWSASAAFLSGIAPFTLLLVSFVLLLGIAFILFTRHIRKYREQQEIFRNSDQQFRPSQERLTSRSTAYARNRSSNPIQKGFLYFFFFLINFIVVLGVNIAFVYVRLYQPSNVLVLAQLMLSIFKVIWNSFCSVYLIRWTDHYLTETEGVDWKEKESGFFGIQLFVSLFNYIAIPCLVVAVISPDCYTNVVISPPKVSTHFSFAECELFVAYAGCKHTKVLVRSTSFNPPFTYSYECSSSLITFYAPAFVYVSFIVSFVNPLFELASQKLHQYTRKGIWWSGQLDYWVPLILQAVSKETEKDKASYDILNPYLDANLLHVTIMTYLGVLLTFGVVFPPLAVCMLINIVITVYSTKLIVGRFATNAISEGLDKYLQILEEECEGAGSIPKLKQCVRLLLVFSFCFYTPFLFDTLGDTVGLQQSYWVIFILPLIAFVGILIKYLMKKTFPEVLRSHDDMRQSRQSNSHSGTSMYDIELHNLSSAGGNTDSGNSIRHTIQSSNRYSADTNSKDSISGSGNTTTSSTNHTSKNNTSSNSNNTGTVSIDRVDSSSSTTYNVLLEAP